MNQTKLNNIDNEYNEYIEAKVCELESDTLNPNDYLAIKKLANRLRTNNLVTLCLGLFFFFVIGSSAYDTIQSGALISNDTFFLLAFLTIIFAFVLFHVCGELYSVRNASFKKAKYGMIEKKFYEIDSCEEGTTTSYYACVVFPNTTQYLNRVKCDKKTYESIMKGDYVLVVSFDNKTSHVISLTE